MFFIDDYIMEKMCMHDTFELTDYSSGCAKCGKLNFYHPIPVGTKTSNGTITSYKKVKFGFGKYRYFIDGNCYDEIEIELLLSK